MTHEEVLDEVNVIYERLSHPEDCENGVYSFHDGNYLEALEILIDFYETGLIEELEKIKTEIKELKSDSDYYEWYGIRRTINLINKHISELKKDNTQKSEPDDFHEYWDEMAIPELKEEDKLTCDRNICLQNEYNNIGCEDCVVMKGENK